MMENFSNKQTIRSSSEPQTLQKTRIEIQIWVELIEMGGGRSTIIFTEDVTGLRHVFHSIATGDTMTNSSFLAYSGEDDAIGKTTRNLRDCLLQDPFFETNFDIEVVLKEKASDTFPLDIYTLVMTSKEIGRAYDCSVDIKDIDLNYIAYETSIQKSIRGNVYEIVSVDRPKEITLVNNPNFVTFQNINEGQRTQSARMSVVFRDNRNEDADLQPITIKITEIQSNKDHTFYGVYNAKDLTEDSFLIDTSERGEIVTAYNFRECLMQNSFFRNNYEIFIRMIKRSDNVLEGGNSVELVSKDYGSQYNCCINAFYGNVSAKTTEIKDVLLNINPNYVNINKDDDITIVMTYGEGDLKTLIASYYTGKIEDAGATDFLIVKPKEGEYTEEEARIATLENLRATLLQFPQSAVSQTFDITLNGSIGLVFSYKISSPYQLLDISAPEILFNYIEIPDEIIRTTLDDYKFRYRLETFYQKSVGVDSIDDGQGDYKIELDVYTNNGVKWGDQSVDTVLGGTYLTTLSKSYFRRPLWFELNTLMSKKSSYSPLFLTAFNSTNTKWIDTGTMNDYRFVARRTRENTTQPIYMSDVLYTINGYDYTLDDSHLGYNKTEVENYILDLSQNFEAKEFNKKVKPLTTNLSRTHIIGQRQYLNYIIKHSGYENTTKLALLYKLYTQSGMLIDTIVDLPIDANKMYATNTTQLNLDSFLPVYNNKTVGQIEVCLIVPIENDPARTYVEISENISFRILPSALHTVKDFAFLNRLGGWDSMNFGGSSSNEFKVTSSTIFKTLQPGFSRYTEIESVSSKSVEEKLTLQSSPLTYNVVEWLREMAASPAVYELSTQRYVLIDDMSLKYNRQDDLFQIDLKYHYSDVFNGRMK